MSGKQPEQKYTIAIREWSEDDRPREKLLKYGEASLSNAELLAIIIRSGTRGKSAVDIGREVLNRFHTLRGMSDADISEFAEIGGLKDAKIAQLKAAVELGRRMQSEERRTDGPVCHSSDVAARLMPVMRDLRKERFLLLLLDRKNVITETVTVNQGTVDQTNPHIREILQRAIRKNAASMIVAHNHPSGSVEPSDQDKDFTRRLVIAAQAAGVTCFDHIIVGDNRYFSFADEGLIARYGMAFDAPGGLSGNR